MAGAWNFGPLPANCRTVREVVEALLRAWGSGKWDDLSRKAGRAARGGVPPPVLRQGDERAILAARLGFHADDRSDGGMVSGVLCESRRGVGQVPGADRRV